MQTITLTQPDDWHIHLRDGDYLKTTVADVARYFARAIVMPNLTPPITTVAQALKYRDEILSYRPAENLFEPLMTLYLTEQTGVEDIRAAAQSPFIAACKLYPAGATTNSDAGITSIANLYPIFAAMERHQLPLLLHGEVTDPSTDIFDREGLFIDQYLHPLVKAFPGLKIVFEHITTLEAVQFVRDAGPFVGATITAHHLLYDRTSMFQGGLKPILYCLPVLKRDVHRAALLEAATSANPKFFIGTDSAPHPRDRKENACGCAAGCYTAASAIELYAEAFAAANQIEKLEGFASHFGPDFYGLPRNVETITLEASPWTLPETLPFGEDELMPLRGGELIQWRVRGEDQKRA
jgi:dihydroorotase